MEFAQNTKTKRNLEEVGMIMEQKGAMFVNYLSHGMELDVLAVVIS